MTSSDWPWPAPIADCGADHLRPGTPLPDIALPAEPGPAVVMARRAGGAIVFIYPWTGRAGLANPPDWDDIPGAHGSTPEIEGFARLYSSFQALGLEVFGLSSQDADHHRELRERLKLPFALLRDENLEFATALRLPTFTTGRVTYLKRLTLIVRDGVIERTFYPVHPPHTHAEDLLANLRR